MASLQGNETLSELRKVRAVVKGQLTKAERLLEHLSCATDDIVRTRLNVVNTYWERFELVQHSIEIKSEEEELDSEITYRTDMEDMYFKLIDQLQLRLAELERVSETEEKLQLIRPKNSDTQTLRPLTSTISFSPFQDDETFKNFTRRLDVFLHLHGQEMQPKDKVYTLLHALSPSLHQKVYDLCAPDMPIDKSYAELVEMLTDYVDPQPSTWALQHKFMSRVQEPNETVKIYSVELQKLTSDCNFNCESCQKSIANTLLRMQFIRGLVNTDIRAKVLQDKTLTSFQDVVKAATAMEIANNESSLSESDKNKTGSVVHQIVDKYKSTSSHVTKNKIPTPNKLHITPNKTPPPLFECLKGKCYRCGSQNHRANTCMFASKICHKCKKQGHLASVCLGNKSTKVHQTEMDSFDVCQDENHEIFKLDSVNSDKIMVDVSIEGKPVSMELDTGSAISTLPYSTFKKLGIKRKMFHTQVQLQTYTREVFKPKGVVFVHCLYKDQQFTGKLYIVDDNLDSIFGRDWLREVQLDWAELKTVHQHSKGSSLDELLEKFKDVFEPGIGKIPDLLGHLQLNEGARPVFMKPRPVPYALKLKVEHELDRLEEAGIISKTQKSEWGTPIVPVVKPNGDVRICADYKVTVNKQIQDEHHPIPKIEDIFANMNGGKLFCTLDLRNAYLHLEMDSNSADIQTLSTHRGQYRVHRLMFGVKVAPGIWQKTMDKILADLDGIQCFFDDIIIQGKSEEELLRRLENVLGKLREKGLRLNRDKCKFLQRRIQYLGHIIDETGIHKCMDKVAAITQARKPKNVSELRTFLGLVNYYNRFIKDLATLLKPLHKLLQKGNTYKWNEQCQQSFEQIKKVISSDMVLCHYSPDLPLVLATDASPVGLGAVISHRFPDGSEKPIAFASRTLTKPEEKYSQIDKEATGIIWGLKKFFMYCYGRKFTLVTDHKPLVTIFNPDKSLPSMSATRLFNYSHFLSGFDYNIEFRKSTDHGNADFLSRFPTETKISTCIDQIDAFQNSQLYTMNLNHKLVAKETSNDADLNKLVHALQNGQSVEKLGFHDGELSLHEGCILKGWRVMIPTSLTGMILKELHIGHMGILKTKALARSFCYWKGQDKDIEEMIASCRQCREKQNAPQQEKNHPWEPPTKPWERIHIDFAGPTNGQYLLLVVDAFTKWLEVVPTKCTTASWTVKELRKIFSTFGLPDLLVSDNGRQFTSYEFTNFLEKCGITHKTTAPYHPSSNGQVERFVQTVKKSLKCMEFDPGTLEEKVHRFLMQIRQAPNSTGTSSYFLMFNRKIRTYLSLLKPRVKYELPCPKGIMRSFKPGDRVQVRSFSGKYKWAFGTVESKDGNLHYYIRMDGGQTWRRHVDQMLRTKL